MKSFLDHEAYFNEPDSDEHMIDLKGKHQDNYLIVFGDQDKVRYNRKIGARRCHTGTALNNYFAFKNKVISFDAAVEATIAGKYQRRCGFPEEVSLRE